MAAAKLAERKKYWLNFCRQIQRVPCMWVMDVAVLLEPLFPICLMRWGSRLTVSIMLMMPADRWIFSRRAFGFDIWHCAEKQSYFRRMLIGVNMLSVSPRPYSISMTDIFMFPQIRFLKIFRLMNRKAETRKFTSTQLSPGRRHCWEINMSLYSYWGWITCSLTYAMIWLNSVSTTITGFLNGNLFPQMWWINCSIN